MKFSRLMLTALIGLCASGAAMAQDWNGFYIGLNAGHISAKSDVNTAVGYTSTQYFLPSEITAINAVSATKLKPSGFSGGATLGYNWQFGHGFFGFEGDYNHFDQGDSRSITFADPFCVGCTYTLTQRVEVGRVASLRMRGGWASKHFLIYGTLGGANTRLTYSEVFTDTFASAYESSWQSHTKGGFVWGVGAEGQWAKHWSVKAEWLHMHFSNMNGAGGTLTTTTGGVVTTWSDSFAHSANLTLDTARVGLSYRF